MYGSLTTIVLIMLWMYFCMMFVMIGAQVNHYFEEKFRWVHKIAAETIRKEYELLTRKEDEEDEEEEEGQEEESQRGENSMEKRNS